MREARQLAGLDPGVVLAAVTEYYGLESGALTRRHDRHIARSVAAWFCRRHTRSDPERTGRSGWASRVPTACRAWYDGWKRDCRSSSQLVEDVKAIVALLSAAPDRPAITTQERPLKWPANVDEEAEKLAIYLDCHMDLAKL